MEAPRPPSAYALLTRLFLRQFLENDLISPESDRTQLLAVVGAMAVSLTLFISMFMSFTYVGMHLTPAQTALRALDDRFFYLALAMLVTALVAATQWDALAIDPRDAAILEPLPVRAGTIRRAKVSAVAILGAAAAVLLNGFPSIVFPALLVFGFRQMPLVSLALLQIAHAIVTIAAAAFGYLVVIAFRETIVAILGRRWFTIVSPWAQGGLIVLLGSALLLLPPSADRIAHRGFEGWRARSPPMWFLGAHEMVAGGVIADLPPGMITPRQATYQRNSSEIYNARRAQFPAMARRAGWAMVLTFALAATAYLWNARRLPSLAPSPPPAFRRRWRLGVGLANTLLVREPAARAGFYFTMAAMWRSNTHRLTLACAASAGLAMAVVAFSGADVQRLGGPSHRLLIMQPLLYGALLVGFRHVIRVPAELRANWGFQLAWRGRDRAFAAGAREAAIVALVLPALAILFPLFVFALGLGPALLHAALGLMGALVLLEALMVTFDKVPFTCTYVPSENMKALAPIYAIAFLLGASFFTRLQVDSLQRGNPFRTLLTLAVVFTVLRVMALRRYRPPQVEFDESPGSFQGLGLHT